MGGGGIPEILIQKFWRKSFEKATFGDISVTRVSVKYIGCTMTSVTSQKMGFVCLIVDPKHAVFSEFCYQAFKKSFVLSAP